MAGDGVVFGLVQADLVARIGAVLGDERVEEVAQREAGLVEFRIGSEGGERLDAIVEAGTTGVAARRSSPKERRVGCPRARPEKFIAGLECLPHARAGSPRVFVRSGSPRRSAPASDGQLSAMKARQAKLSKVGYGSTRSKARLRCGPARRAAWVLLGGTASPRNEDRLTKPGLRAAAMRRLAQEP